MLLNHRYELLSSAISGNYIATVIQYCVAYYGKSGIQINQNSEGCQLVKIFRAPERIMYLWVLDGGCIDFKLDVLMTRANVGSSVIVLRLSMPQLNVCSDL